MKYEATTKVYCTNLGKEFGTTIHYMVEATSIDNALEIAKEKFDKYVARLQKNHNNKFEYDYISIISPF